LGIVEKLYGIIGYPLGHSMSPLVHNRGFRVLGINSTYLRWALRPGQMPEFMAAVRVLPISGVSVTIPHKQRIMPYLDACTTDARKAGAVNTLFWREEVLWGDNTDVRGFLSPLEERRDSIQSALVLGVGGAARAVVWGLQKFGVQNMAVCGRDAQKTSALARTFHIDTVNWDQRGTWQGDLLVNATPLGMSGYLVEENPWPNRRLDTVRIVYDLIYNPIQTRLRKLAQESGVEDIGGLEMFLAQADAQFKLWTGQPLPLHDVYPLVLEALQQEPDNKPLPGPGRNP